MFQHAQNCGAYFNKCGVNCAVFFIAVGTFFVKTKTYTGQKGDGGPLQSASLWRGLFFQGSLSGNSRHHDFFYYLKYWLF